MGQDLISALPIPVFIIGPDQTITQMNAEAIYLLGADFTARMFQTVLRQPGLLGAITTTQTTGARQDVPFVQSLAGRDVVYGAVCMARDDGSVVVSFRDDSHLYDAEQLRSDFVANVSHELRSPLTAMIGFIETMRGPARDDLAAHEHFLEIMARETDRMNCLIQDLLSLSRVEVDEKNRPDKAIDLAAALNASVSLCAGGADKNGTHIRVTMAAIPDEFALLADKDQLQQVFNNLIENAIKYGDKDSEIRIDTRFIPHDPALRSAAICISIANRGGGIEAVHIPRLTERFYRVDEDRSRNSGGTGLGLAIVKHIVNRHRGRLKINSKVGEGSEFSVFLPLSTKGD